MTATKTYNDTFDNMLLKCPALLSLSYQKRHIRLPSPSACLRNTDSVALPSLCCPLGMATEKTGDEMETETFARRSRSRLSTNQGDKYVPPTTDNNTI